MQFKGNSQALKGQFESDEVNPILRVACRTLDSYTYEYFSTPTFTRRLVITSVLRLPSVQVDWCKKGKYRSRFEHTAGEAFDIRSRNLAEGQIEKLLCFARSYLSGFCKLEYHEKKDPKNKERWIIPPHFHLTTAGHRRRQEKICEIVKNTEGASACFAG